MAERGVFVKDAAKLSVEISDRCDWARSCLKEFLSILLIERNCVVTGWTDGRFGNVKLT